MMMVNALIIGQKEIGLRIKIRYEWMKERKIQKYSKNIYEKEKKEIKMNLEKIFQKYPKKFKKIINEYLLII